MTFKMSANSQNGWFGLGTDELASAGFPAATAHGYMVDITDGGAMTNKKEVCGQPSFADALGLEVKVSFDPAVSCTEFHIECHGCKYTYTGSFSESSIFVFSMTWGAVDLVAAEYVPAAKV